MAITLMLLARRRVTATEVARTFEVAERTAYRDLQGLSEAGLPVRAVPGAGGGYELVEGYRLMPLTLSPEEGVAVWVLLQGALQGGPHPLQAAARQAWHRISVALPESLRRRILDLSERVDVSRLFDAGAQAPGDVFGALIEGLWQRRRLVIVYHNPLTGERTERPVDPWGLACIRGRWYLAALCHLRQAMRTFRLDRIEQARVTPEAYMVNRSFVISRWARELAGIEDGVEAGHPRLAMRVRFSARAARRLLNDRNFQSGWVRLEDGSFEVRMAIRPDEVEYYAGLVLGYAGEAIALEPPELRTSIVARAAELARAHGELHGDTNARPGLPDPERAGGGPASGLRGS